jgi:hypothetical protein
LLFKPFLRDERSETITSISERDGEGDEKNDRREREREIEHNERVG